MRSEIIKFGEELEALLRKDIKEAVLSADEEEIEFKVKLKKIDF
ncbi:hypothetical protein ACT7DZ_23590 [Bacillus cereus]